MASAHKIYPDNKAISKSTKTIPQAYPRIQDDHSPYYSCLDVLVSSYSTEDLPTQVDVPEQLLDSFGASCRAAELVDEAGYFNDPYKLVSFFCRK